MELLLDVFRSSSTQPVEDVIVPLLLTLRADTGLLQKVMGHKSTYYCILENKSALHSNKCLTNSFTKSHICITISIKKTVAHGVVPSTQWTTNSAIN